MIISAESPLSALQLIEQHEYELSPTISVFDGVPDICTPLFVDRIV